MSGKRWYSDSCGLAQALNVVGERWALLVVRELLLGPRRFADLRADLPGISSNVLAQRLGELEERGVVCRRRLAPPASAWVYDLTEWGAELEQVVKVLGRWGARSPLFDPHQHLSRTSVVMSMRTMFRPDAAAGLHLAMGIRMGEQHHVARVDDGRLEVGVVPALPPLADLDAVVTLSPSTLAGILYAATDLEEAVESGTLVIEGDRGALERYAACFWLPEPASAG